MVTTNCDWTHGTRDIVAESKVITQIYLVIHSWFCVTEIASNSCKLSILHIRYTLDPHMPFLSVPSGQRTNDNVHDLDAAKQSYSVT